MATGRQNSVMQNGTILYFVGEFVPKNEDIHSYNHYKAIVYNGDGALHESWVPENNMYELNEIFKDTDVSLFVKHPSLDFKFKGKKIIELYDSIIDKSKKIIITETDLFVRGQPVTIIPKGTKLELIGNTFEYNGFYLNYERANELPELPKSILIRNNEEWKLVKKVFKKLFYTYNKPCSFPFSIKPNSEGKTTEINQPNPADINGNEFLKFIISRVWR